LKLSSAKPKLGKSKISKDLDTDKFKKEAKKFNTSIKEIATKMYNKGTSCSRNIIKTIKVSKDSNYSIIVKMNKESRRFEMIYICTDPNSDNILNHKETYSKEKDIIADINKISDLIDNIKDNKK
jgi:hypothetical protein